MTLTEKALRIALEAHTGQMRKGSPTPYIAHPVLVALMLREYDVREEVIAGALLHDVLEDTEVKREELVRHVGEEVVALVEAVSEDKSLVWRKRKEAYIEQVRNANDEVKAISAGDKVHNLSNLLDEYEMHGEEVWKFFSVPKEEKVWFEEAMLSMLESSWTHPLVTRYRKLVERLRALV